MQRHSKPYTGHLGTNYDADEIGIPEGQARLKRNSRLTGSNSKVSTYIEGHTDANLSLSMSNNLLITVIDSKWALIGFQQGILYEFTFDIVKDTGGTFNVSVSTTFESIDKFYLVLAQAIRDAGLVAGSVGQNVKVAYNDEDDPSADNSGVLTMGNFIGISSSFFNTETFSISVKDLFPVAYKSQNEEAILLTLIPTYEPLNKIPYSLCQIWRITYNAEGLPIKRELKYNDYLNYALDKKPFIKGVIENGCIERIYISDGRQNLRSFNINQKDIFGTPVKSSTISPESPLPTPDVLKIENGGLLPTGAVQYTYRVVSANGGVSLTAPFSNVVYLPEGSMTDPSIDMYGNEPEIISGKSVNVRINAIDLQFERIQIIAIYRQTELAITDTEIIYDGVIETGEVNLVHSRKGDGAVLNVFELFTDNKIWNINEVMEIHENHLIVADVTGIKESLNTLDHVVRQYDVNGDTYSGNFNPDPDTYKYCLDEAENVNGGNALLVQGGQSDGYATGNGIKIWYQMDEALVDDGLQGSQPWGNGNIDLKTAFGVDTIKSGRLLRNYNPGVAASERVSDLFYGDYYEGSNNPLMGSRYAGYQQYETYRLGLVATKNGKDENVLFLGDFRMPDYLDEYFDVNADFKHEISGTVPDTNKNKFVISRTESYTKNGKLNTDHYVRSLKLVFDVRLPSEFRENYDGFKIVRAERKDGDRSVFGQGVATQVMQYFNHAGSNNLYGQGAMDSLYGPSPCSYYQSNGSKNQFWVVNSPDVLFGVDKHVHLPGDEIYFINALRPYKSGFSKDTFEHWNLVDQNTYSKFPRPRIGVFAFTENLPSELFPNRYMEVENAAHIDRGTTLSGSIYQSTTNFKNESRGPIIAETQFSVTGGHRLGAQASTFFYLKDNPNLNLNNNDVNIALVEIRRNINSQYGGQTELSLIQTQWIEASPYIPILFQGSTFVCGGGDVYSNLIPFTKYDDAPRERRSIKHIGNFNQAVQHKVFQDSGNSLNIAIPCNSLGNYAFTHGEHFGGEPWNYIDTPEHLFNKAYMAKNDTKRHAYIPKEKLCEDVRFYGTIAVSRNKVNGQQVDRWLQFPAFDFFEADLSLGKITHLISKKNILWLVQENGIGILSFDPFALQNTENGTEIQIQSGTGNKIRKLQYISKKHGSRHKHFRIDGNDGTYIIDDRNFEIYLFTDKGYKPIAKEKGYNHWLRKMFKDKKIPDMPLLYEGVHGYHDMERDEIVIQIDQP